MSDSIWMICSVHWGGEDSIIKDWNSMQQSILMYKTLHGVTPDYLRSRFVYGDDVSAYRLGNTENQGNIKRSGPWLLPF